MLHESNKIFKYLDLNSVLYGIFSWELHVELHWKLNDDLEKELGNGFESSIIWDLGNELDDELENGIIK